MANVNAKELGERIANLRKIKNMTQEELATRLCISAQAVSKWERGIGLPDISIFPSLAEVLEVPVGVLFGESTDDADIPETYECLKFVAEFDNFACYSDKTVLSVDKHEISFTDGSTADLREQSVINRGRGEIRIIEVERTRKYDPKARELEYPVIPFTSLRILSAFPCTVNVAPSKDGKSSIKADGSPLFISMIETEQAEDSLEIKIKNSNKSNREKGSANVLTVYMTEEQGKMLRASISGSGSIISDIPFHVYELGISGSGNIRVPEGDRLTAKISGSGDMYCGDIYETAEMHIAGSGDIHAGELGKSLLVRISGSGDVEGGSTGSADVVIAGSGDVSIGRLTESLSLKISGAGDMHCSGNVEKLTASIVGSGTLDGKELTARDADITLSGSADVTLERIINSSIEKISKSSSLKVGRRG